MSQTLLSELFFGTEIDSLKTKKDIFLHKISSKKGYKRYNGSPLRYGGGKSLAVGKILEYLPNDINRVVSPFIGGGSVEIAIAKELEVEVVAYDVFDLLVNYWNIQVSEPQKLYERLCMLKNSKEEYEEVKNKLRAIWNKNDGLLPNNYSNLDLATYYYFSHNLSYGPGFLGWMSSIYLEDKKYFSMLEKVRNFNVSNLKVFNESFETSIPKHKDDFLYLDPPYFLEGDSKMFRGIYPMRNFPIHHNGFNHQLLVDLLKQHKGGFILSYNDCSWIREAYKDFEIIEVRWQYTMGQGETRIGKNRLERDYDNDNKKSSHELLIIG
ncbi:DNA adenine methylase [Capnocytophaga cynodegmi]|uniref:DNA adenine methylase n=1 Tax=Capnocytophaga cynodegmi TaxID=28189 RepID=UPI001BB3B93C|nr:DNA adenine methylase [Capnocytophaga cynodegmi]